MAILCLMSTVRSFVFRNVRIMNKGYLHSTSDGTDATSLSPEPFPGSPIVKRVDKELNVAYMKIALTGAQTQKAFNEACDIFNVEVKKKDLKVPGFRAGTKLPAAYLYQIFGEDQVKSICANLLSQEIQDECERTGLMFVGKGRVTNFYGNKFDAGKPHAIDIECDLWPKITYGGEKGYKGLEITVESSKIDSEKYEQVKNSIRGRYKITADTASDYSAQLGDVIVANMQGFMKTSSGGKGDPLPAVATGDDLEITLEEGKFMEGMIEGLVGAKAGEMKTISVQFPKRDKGPGAALSGKDAIFEVNVSAVKKQALPEWNEELAGRIREGMSLEALEKELEDAVKGENESENDSIRNDALANALLDIVTVDNLPESIMEEQTLSRFQTMLMDFKEQGSTDAQLDEMSSPENYEKYKEVSRKNVEKVVKLSLAFRDIAEKEKVEVTANEVADQYNMIVAQAKQKGEPVPDKARVSQEIQDVLLRKKVFDVLAATAKVNWTEAPAEE